MNLSAVAAYFDNPFALAGAAFLLAAAFWLILAKGRKRVPAASRRIDAAQVIFLLSLLAMLTLAVLHQASCMSRNFLIINSYEK